MSGGCVFAGQNLSEYTVGLFARKNEARGKTRSHGAVQGGDIDVLVSTTVIEVGVDVANATVMIVEDADRFGLAQLHQLQGASARRKPGQAFLVASSSDAEAMERLSAMERTEDGFELAEFDLSFRREGDILGNRQHGASSLKLVNIVRDRAVVEAAHADALKIVSDDPGIAPEELTVLRHELAAVFPPDADGR
ncbi:MAG: helicase-related protein [Slackia sp.]